MVVNRRHPSVRPIPYWADLLQRNQITDAQMRTYKAAEIRSSSSDEMSQKRRPCKCDEAGGKPSYAGPSLGDVERPTKTEVRTKTHDVYKRTSYAAVGKLIDIFF